MGEYVQEMFRMAGYAKPDQHTTDDRIYSNGCGSLHCGTNVQRAIPSYKWWEK
jgi:hypothetical protein